MLNDERRWVEGFWDHVLSCLVRQKKCLPLYKRPMGERIGRVLWKSVRNYFWESRLAKFCELGVTLEVNLVLLVHLIWREEDFRYGLGDGRVVWLECWNGLPRSRGVGLPVDGRVGTSARSKVTEWEVTPVLTSVKVTISLSAMSHYSSPPVRISSEYFAWRSWYDRRN
jgi:hypothetical protein